MNCPQEKGEKCPFPLGTSCSECKLKESDVETEEAKTMNNNDIDFQLVTIPTVWSNQANVKNDCAKESECNKQLLIQAHKNGYHVTQMTSYVLHDVVYITYYLERK